MRAAELMVGARMEPNPVHRREIEHLVLCYLRLADQADRNGETDLVYEPPWDHAADHQAQQQQQPQPKPKPKPGEE